MKLAGYLFCIALAGAGVTPAVAGRDGPIVYLPYNPATATCKPPWKPLQLNLEKKGKYIVLEPGQSIVIKDARVASLFYLDGTYLPRHDMDNHKGAACSFSECGATSVLLTCLGIGPSNAVLFKRK
jgi:hypothetical protein